jgi:hypothetical protein
VTEYFAVTSAGMCRTATVMRRRICAMPPKRACTLGLRGNHACGEVRLEATSVKQELNRAHI